VRAANLLTTIIIVALGSAPGRGQSKPPRAPAAGETGGVGLALVAKKALTVPPEGPQFIDNAVLLVKDGRIEAVGSRADTPIPAGYQVVDLGSRWIMPGMIDLHSHVAGTFDINDMVYLCNPGLRVSCSVIPANPRFRLALAAGADRASS